MKDIEKGWRELAAGQYGAIAGQQLQACGLSAKQVEGRAADGVLERVHRGVFRLAGSPDTFEQRTLLACVASGGVASHRSAAGLWGFRRCATGLIEVTVAGRRAPRVPGAIVHTSNRLRNIDISAVGAIPVTSPARTLLDLGAVAPPDVVESATEDALRRGLVSYDWLERMVGRTAVPGRNGSGVLRGVLAVRSAGDPPTESVLEDELLRVIRSGGLPPPVRQHWLEIEGFPRIRLDFAYPPARLAIEAQSVMWHTGREQLQRDCEKQNLLLALGWRLLLFTWADVHRRPEAVVSTVRLALSGNETT